MATVLGPKLTLLLAVTAGLGAANLYYAQPMIGLLEASFGVHGAAVAQVSTASQIGYTLGILLLVPLGDRFDRRRVILALNAMLIVSLLAAAAAPSLPWLILASAAIGVAATLAQQAVPLAASLAAPGSEGLVIGRVISGLLAGILLARTLSGVVSEHYGWRAMFYLGAAMATALLAATWFALPSRAPIARPSYAGLLRSVLSLAMRYGVLRRAAIVQGLVFAGFSAFWSTLALYLKQPPFLLGSAAAGLFGMLGLAGVLIAPLAGKMTGRFSAWLVTGMGVLLVLFGWLVAGVVPGLTGLALGVILLDAGVQASLVGNQSDVFALDPAAQSRLNTVFVAGIFLGGALGSVCGSLAWFLAGWTGVVLTGAGFTCLALVVHRAWDRRPVWNSI
jgi:predicted MFS family arabinose efflux permease